MDIQPQSCAASELSYRLRGTAQHLVASNEPSHIHVPRPSRLNQPASMPADAAFGVSGQLPLEEAA